MKILGFDLGDGESAVTLLDEDSTVEPRVLPIGGKASVISAVGTKDGRIVIGDEASVLAGAQDVKVRFKSRYLTDPAASADVRLFAQGVMAQLMQSEPALMAQVGRTVVGCPAGWGAGRREQYAALLESAGFPNVSVVPEPRAAFLYARHARGLRVEAELLRESAMVIDIGSSTTDFAYIVDGHQQEQAIFGDTNLGGGVLDELILTRAVKRSPDEKALARVMAQSPAWKSYCELEARKIKESYFADEEKWQEQPITKQVVVCYDETIVLSFVLDAMAMQDVIHMPVTALGGRSFVQCLADSLGTAARMSENCPPKVIILTGGASRMAFFRAACREAFPDALCVICPEPECSIARGLAYAGRVDAHLAVFRKEVASIARGERLYAAVSANVHELYEPVARALFDAAQECTLSAVSRWRRGKIETIDALEKVIEKKIAAAMAGEDIRERIADELRVWLAELMGTLEGELTVLCTRCGVPPEHMALNAAQLNAGVDGVQLSLLDAMGMDVVSGLLGIVLAVVGASVGGGGGMALVSAGPLGMVAGAGAGILLALVGKNGMEKAIRRASLPLLLRQAVTDGAVRRGLARQRDESERAIIRALADPANGFAARLSAGLSKTLGAQLERMAKDAEMSICA